MIINNRFVSIVDAVRLGRCIALGLLQGGLVALMVSANAALILPGRSSLPEWTSLRRGLTPTSAAVIGVTLLALFRVTNVPVLAAQFDFGPLLLAALAVGVAMVLPLQAVKRLVRLA
jgi:Ca2+-transporting ATPase